MIHGAVRQVPPPGCWRPAGVRARLEGAMSRRRLRGWNPPLENINTLVASGGPKLLARSRELVVTNGYAANACEAFAANLVGRRHQALVADRGRRPGSGPAALARLDRRGRRRRADRLLRPAGHGRARDVRGGRVLRAAAPAPGRGRAAGAAADAAAASRDAALREDRHGGQRQSHPLRDRVR